MNSFINTVSWKRFSEGTIPNLINAIKTLSEKMDNWEQYTLEIFPASLSHAAIKAEIETGSRFVNAVVIGNTATLIFERKTTPKTS